MRISSVAAKLFNTKGYLQTTMDDLTAAARFSKGGIYHYFSSKDEIWYDPKGAVNSEALSKIICKIFLHGVDGFRGSEDL